MRKAIAGQPVISLSRLATRPTIPGMPALVEKADGRFGGSDPGTEAIKQRLGLTLHLLLQRASLQIQAIEPGRQRLCRGRIAGEQTIDANGHVLEPPRCIQPRRNGKTHVGTAGKLQLTAGHPKQRLDSRSRTSRAHAPQTFCHQDAVIEIQWHRSATVPSATRSRQSVTASRATSAEMIPSSASRLPVAAIR